MRGYIRVTSTPYAAATDLNGRGQIEGSPRGTYRVTVWHPRSRGNGNETVQPIANCADSVPHPSLRPLAALRPRTSRARIATSFMASLAGVMAVTVGVAGSGVSLFAHAVAGRDMAANARVFEQSIAGRAGQSRD
ncbi:hypothetical protein OY671_011961, partial [Metschnikowia pulcherrima]